MDRLNRMLQAAQMGGGGMGGGPAQVSSDSQQKPLHVMSSLYCQE